MIQNDMQRVLNKENNKKNRFTMVHKFASQKKADSIKGLDDLSKGIHDKMENVNKNIKNGLHEMKKNKF